MKFSLINVDKQSGEFVDGVWIQDHIGTLETAVKKAKDTEKTNGNRIIVAVVEDLNVLTQNYCLRENLKRLD